MEYIVRPAARMIGAVTPPADKSVAHRSALFAAIAEGVSRIHGYPRGADTLSTVSCLNQLGVSTSWEGDTLIVEGAGRYGFQAPSQPLDCGNSGTTMRLMAGLLAGQPFNSELTGDVSLRRRPMGRIADPLGRMGAEITLTDGKAPIRIRGNKRLKGLEYVLPMASAQVKSAVLLAGLYASGRTAVVESIPSRDHTERMLKLDVAKVDGKRVIYSDAGVDIPSVEMHLPGDISAAGFFLVAALMVPDSRIDILGVGINPSRSGVIDVLETAGAVIEGTRHRNVGREPVCDLLVTYAPIDPIEVDATLAPRLIDEIPVLAVAATVADGTSKFEGVGELRAKESDRIAVVCSMLSSMGVTVGESKESFTVDGPAGLSGARVDSRHDHRIAMAAGIAGLAAEGETLIEGAEIADVSYPTFWEDLERLSGR